MPTLTLSGLKAALLANHTAQTNAVFALEETSEADMEKAVARLVAPGISYEVVYASTRAGHRSWATLPVYSEDESDLKIFWDADLYTDTHLGALETVLSNPKPGTVFLVHGHQLRGTPIGDLLDRHQAQWARFDLEPTPVIFRAEKKGIYKGQVTAVFPTLPGTYDPSSFGIYAHVGQHGSGSHGWYVETRAAKPEECTELAQELERIGYLLDVRQRWTQKFDADRLAHLRSMAA